MIMAATRVSVRKRQSRRESRKNLELEFPSKPNKPSEKLSEAITMIYGAKKVGKTSLAAQFSKNMLHIMCEPMARELPITQVDAPDYEHFSEWCRMLVEDKHKYDSVSVDTLPLVYKYAMAYTGKVKGFEHPHDEKDFGKSWGFVFDDFNRPIQLLLHSKLGVIFHAHEIDEEIETRDGSEFTRKKPEGSKQVWEFINANIENIWYFHVRGNTRFLQVRGDDYAFACTAFVDKFYTPSDEQIFAIPMGKSPEEGYKNLVKAFKNKQEETYEDFREVQVETPKRKTARRRK
jgi:hypothetical protein